MLFFVWVVSHLLNLFITMACAIEVIFDVMKF